MFHVKHSVVSVARSRNRPIALAFPPPPCYYVE